LRLRTFEQKIWIALPISVANFFISYYLNTNTIIDERTYAGQSYRFYRYHELPEIYPLLSILTANFLALFGVEKQAFLAIPFAATLLTVGLTYKLSIRQSGSRITGSLASTLVACNPVLIWLSAKHMTENLFALLLVVTFLMIVGKDVSHRQAFLAGIFSFLAYLCRYPGLILFPVIMVLLILKKATVRVLLAYFLPLTLVAAYWGLNWFVFGRPLTTEAYSFGTLYAKSEAININLSLPLLGDIAYKVAAAVILVFGYAFIFLFSQVRRTTLRNPIVLFAVVYVIVHLGYYVILSLSWSFAWSIDHLARYLVPISPSIMSLSCFPSRLLKLNHLLLLFFSFTGILIGAYLTAYSVMHSQVPVSWEDFLKSL